MIATIFLFSLVFGFLKEDQKTSFVSGHALLKTLWLLPRTEMIFLYIYLFYILCVFLGSMELKFGVKGIIYIYSQKISFWALDLLKFWLKLCRI